MIRCLSFVTWYFTKLPKNCNGKVYLPLTKSKLGVKSHCQIWSFTKIHLNSPEFGEDSSGSFFNKAFMQRIMWVCIPVTLTCVESEDISASTTRDPTAKHVFVFSTGLIRVWYRCHSTTDLTWYPILEKSPTSFLIGSKQLVCLPTWMVDCLW